MAIFSKNELFNIRTKLGLIYTDVWLMKMMHFFNGLNKTKLNQLYRAEKKDDWETSLQIKEEIISLFKEQYQKHSNKELDLATSLALNAFVVAYCDRQTQIDACIESLKQKCPKECNQWLSIDNDIFSIIEEVRQEEQRLLGLKNNPHLAKRWCYEYIIAIIGDTIWDHHPIIRPFDKENSDFLKSLIEIICAQYKLFPGNVLQNTNKHQSTDEKPLPAVPTISSIGKKSFLAELCIFCCKPFSKCNPSSKKASHYLVEDEKNHQKKVRPFA